MSNHALHTSVTLAYRYTRACRLEGCPLISSAQMPQARSQSHES